VTSRSPHSKQPQSTAGIHAQMWKAAGLTPKVVGKRPADGGTPTATPQSRSGGAHHQQHFGRSGLSSGSFSGFSELNPKSLKVRMLLHPCCSFQHKHSYNPSCHIGFRDMPAICPPGSMLALRPSALAGSYRS